MTIRVYDIAPDGQVTEIVPKYEAAQSLMFLPDDPDDAARPEPEPEHARPGTDDCCRP